MEPDVEVATAAARAASDVIRDRFGGLSEVRMKGRVDPVTDVDTEAEEAARSIIGALRPHDAILGEEWGGSPWQSERVWILDPLDGTVNFVQGIPHVAVSVALWDSGAPQVGVVVDVMRQEEFTAIAGQGARLDEQRLSASETKTLRDSVLVTGFPYDRNERGRSYGVTVGAVLEHVRGVRRFGSAALDFAWVACGRFDGYWEYGLGPWDAAAGLLIVQEAGGRVSDHAGFPYNLGSDTIIASNGHIHAHLSALVTEHLPPHLR